MSAKEQLLVVFTAQSKLHFYCRDAVCQFVFDKGAVPINPFRVFEYFLGDRVDRDLVRKGNNNLIRIADQLWVFGDQIADGVLAEILYARDLKKKIKYFTIHNRADGIREITTEDLKFEPEVYRLYRRNREGLIDLILGISTSDGEDRSLLPFTEDPKK